MPAPLDLLDHLADARFHSGSELGRALRIAPTTVHKHVRALEAMGLEIYAVRGRGYRLAQPLERLEADAIREHAGSHAAPVYVHAEVASTSAWLSEQAGDGENGTACIAERQTAGRGRRGRTWSSPFGRNLYLSLLWRLPARAVSGLAIAVGVTVAEACEALGARGLALKWPNDIVGPRGKVGGILIDLGSEARDMCTAIIGIGLNVDMPARLREAIGQPVSDLNELAGRRLSRNALAGAVIQRLVQALPRFEAEGLAPFRGPFAERDASRDRPVSVEVAGQVSTGHARGIDERGALLLETADGMARIQTGEVSLRALT